jgi:hypothetical protein
MPSRAPPFGNRLNATLCCGECHRVRVCSCTDLNEASMGIALQITEVAGDYIHLYRGEREALTSSLDHIQHAASQILRAIEQAARVGRAFGRPG